MTTDSGAANHGKIKPRLQKHESDTQPAELIAAAHASSFSKALSKELGLVGSKMGNIFTSSSVTLGNVAAGWMITNIHLVVLANLPGVTQGRFIDATVRARTSCFISRLLHVNISMNAKLESEPQLEARRKSKTKSRVEAPPHSQKALETKDQSIGSFSLHD